MTDDKKYPTWQRLVNAAYEKWQRSENKGMKYGDFVESLDPLSREAVLVAGLNGQVLNGGFRQWVDNGYAVKIKETLQVLACVEGDATRKVAGMVERLSEFVRTDVESRGCFGDYWVEDDDRDAYGGRDFYDEGYYEEEDGPSEGEMLAEEMDDGYYDIDKKFAGEVEAYFAGGRHHEPLALPQKAEPRRDEDGVRFPSVKVKLVGENGNAFAVMGSVREALRRGGASVEELEKFMAECMSGDYDHLLQTCMRWVNVS